MWDRSWLPIEPLMHEPIVDEPPDRRGRPFNSIAMEVLGRIKTEINEDWRTSVPIFKPRPFASWVIVHIQQQLGCILAKKLNIDLLARGISVQEDSSYHARGIRRSNFSLEPTVQEPLAATNRSRGIVPHARAFLMQR
jgi:hypothetical protein